MKTIEIVLGASVLTLGVLSVLFINLGLAPSRLYPGQLTYSELAQSVRYLLFPLLLIVGFVTIGHGIHERRVLEAVFGISLLLWGLISWGFVAIILIDGGDPYIFSRTDDLIEVSFFIMPSIFLGIALILDGKKKAESIIMAK